MRYDRATLLSLNDEAFALLDELKDGGDVSSRLRDWAARVGRALAAGPGEDGRLVGETVSTLADVLAAADAPIQTALQGALVSVIKRLYPLARDCKIAPPAVADREYRGFLRAALREEGEFLGSPIDASAVATRAHLDRQTTYRCVVRLVNEGLGNDDLSGGHGFQIYSDSVERAIERLGEREESQDERLTGASPEAKRVLFVAALSLEAAAVKGHLTGVREDLHQQGTIYEVGVFETKAGERLEVMVAKTGRGNTLASQETERALTHFRPSIAIFVGVAGGRKDTAHGDVVVASKVYGYESGKDEAGGFKPRPEAASPSYPLRSRADHEATGTAWLARLPSIPSPSPRVLSEPIASGEKLVRSGASAVAEMLGELYSDAVAVEMEGFGFLRACQSHHHVQALVIRGVSDLLDDKTAADAAGGQQAAATHAAAFAFEVLDRFVSTLPRAPVREPTPGSAGSTPHELTEAANVPVVLHPIESPPFDGWVELPPVAKLLGRNDELVEPMVYQLRADLLSPVALTKTELNEAVQAAIVVYGFGNYERTARWPRAPIHGTGSSYPDGLRWTHAYQGEARNEVGDEQLLVLRSGAVIFQRDEFWDCERPAIDLGGVAFDTWRFVCFTTRLLDVLRHSSELSVSIGLIRPHSYPEIGAHFRMGIHAENDCVATLARRSVGGQIRVKDQDVRGPDEIAKVTKRLVDQVANEFEVRTSWVSASQAPMLSVALESIRKSILNALGT